MPLAGRHGDNQSNLHGLKEKKTTRLSDQGLRDWISHKVEWSGILFIDLIPTYSSGDNNSIDTGDI